MDEGLTVNKKEFADILGVSPKTVSNHIDNGMPTLGGGGRGRAVKINTKQGINWLVEKEISRRYGDDDEETQSNEDRELKRARREKLELEIENLKKLVLPFDAIEEILFRLATVYSSQLDSIASRLASDVAAVDDPAECRQIIYSETRRIRASTADALCSEVQKLTQEIDEILESDDGYSESTT